MPILPDWVLTYKTKGIYVKKTKTRVTPCTGDTRDGWRERPTPCSVAMNILGLRPSGNASCRQGRRSIDSKHRSEAEVLDELILSFVGSDFSEQFYSIRFAQHQHAASRGK